MAIAVKVAKVSGAVRCRRWGIELEGDRSARVKHSSLNPTLAEMRDNTLSYIKRARREILNDLRSRKSGR